MIQQKINTFINDSILINGFKIGNRHVHLNSYKYILFSELADDFDI